VTAELLLNLAAKLVALHQLNAVLKMHERVRFPGARLPGGASGL
jgi:hypothetical protein